MKLSTFAVLVFFLLSLHSEAQSIGMTPVYGHFSITECEFSRNGRYLFVILQNSWTNFGGKANNRLLNFPIVRIDLRTGVAKNFYTLQNRYLNHFSVAPDGNMVSMISSRLEPFNYIQEWKVVDTAGETLTDLVKDLASIYQNCANVSLLGLFRADFVGDGRQVLVTGDLSCVLDIDAKQVVSFYDLKNLGFLLSPRGDLLICPFRKEFENWNFPAQNKLYIANPSTTIKVPPFYVEQDESAWAERYHSEKMVSVSSDEQLLGYRSESGMQFVDLKKSKVLKMPSIDGDIIKFDVVEKRAFIARENRISVFDPERRVLEPLFQTESVIKDIKINPSGRTMAVLMVDGRVVFYDLRDRMQTGSIIFLNPFDGRNKDSSTLFTRDFAGMIFAKARDGGFQVGRLVLDGVRIDDSGTGSGGSREETEKEVAEKFNPSLLSKICTGQDSGATDPGKYRVRLKERANGGYSIADYISRDWIKWPLKNEGLPEPQGMNRYYLRDGHIWLFRGKDTVFLWGSSDTGRTWVKKTILPRNIGAIEGFNITGDRHIWISGNLGNPADGNAFVAESQDAGVNWHFTPFDTSWLVRLSVVDAEVAYVSQRNYLWKTVDSGQNWTILRRGTSIISDIHFRNEREGSILWYGSRITRTRDGGRTWTDVLLPLGGSYQQIYDRDDQNIYVAGSNQLLYSKDGGKTWGREVFDGNIQDFSFDKENTGWLIEGSSLYLFNQQAK